MGDPDPTAARRSKVIDGVPPNELTASTALVPPMVGILLDRETRSKTECEKLMQNSHGVLHFLDATMLENYVLHPAAIAHVLRQHGESVETSEVGAHLKQVEQPVNEGHTDGAKILSSIFDRFTETRTSFKKTRDVPAIIAWLLTEDAEFLRPLGDFLRRLFGLAIIETTGRIAAVV